MNGRPRWAYVILGVLFVTLASGMLLVLSELGKRSEGLRYGRELVLWDLMNTSHLLGNLTNALYEYEQNPGPVGQEEIQYRLDLAWGRVDQTQRVISRPDYQRLDAAAVLEGGMVLMSSIEPLVFSEKPLGLDDARRIRLQLSDLQESFHKLGIKSYRLTEDVRINHLERVDSLYIAVVGLFAGVIIIGLSIMRLIYGEHRTVRRLYQEATDARQELDEANVELRGHRDNLQALVDERTADLLLAKELAESANKAKSEFLAKMSHELRTPMHAILSFAQIGEKRAADGKTAGKGAKNYYHRILTSGRRLMSLLNDLLDLSKLEAGQMILEQEQVALSELFEIAVNEFDGAAKDKSQLIEVAEIDTALHLYADPDRMLQVLRNLLSNAIKFSPEGTSIIMRARLVNDEVGSAVRITVEDNGPGIPAEELEAVFDKFIQSSKNDNKIAGTGLGLAICREIVELHGGRIEAQNRESGGASFIMHLPVDGAEKRSVA